jgi:hypothetical protein
LNSYSNPKVRFEDEVDLPEVVVLLVMGMLEQPEEVVVEAMLKMVKR